MSRYKFKEDEVPYAILEEFGLTQEMIEDLPTDVYTDILSGRLSPVLPISIKDKKGRTVSARARFKLVRDADDETDIVFHPRLVHCDLDCYSPREQEALRSGKAIISHAPDDETAKCFVQIDTGTNQVIYVPTPVIGKNISHLIDIFELSSGEIQAIQEGDVVCITDDDEEVSVGIDLTEKSGLRLVLGDSQKWHKEKGEPTMSRYSFGIYGCWFMDQDGNLDYVHEQDYTEEFWDEMKKAIARNSGLKR
jgi:hypothetical protein